MEIYNQLRTIMGNKSWFFAPTNKTKENKKEKNKTKRKDLFKIIRKNN